MPLQTRILESWPDGSARWVLLDWQADVAAESAARYRVEIGKKTSPDAGSPRVQVRRDGSNLVLDTGAARFALGAGGAFPFEAVTVAGDRPAIDAGRTGLTVIDEAGQAFQPKLERVELAEQGPLRVAVAIEGRLEPVRPGGQPLCRLFGWLHFYAGLAAVRIDLTLHNPRRAGHPGNCWSLGDAGSVYLRDAALTVALPHDTAPARSGSRPSRPPP